MRRGRKRINWLTPKEWSLLLLVIAGYLAMASLVSNCTVSLRLTTDDGRTWETGW